MSNSKIRGEAGRERERERAGCRANEFGRIDLEDATCPKRKSDVCRDAEDAVRGRHGSDYDGSRLRVEHTKGMGPRGPGGRPMGGGGYGDRGYGGRDGGRDGGNRDSDRFSERAGGYGAGYGAFGKPRGGGKRTGHRVIVTGLPTTGSWQDLKDHMREAGDVCYTDVFK